MQIRRGSGLAHPTSRLLGPQLCRSTLDAAADNRPDHAPHSSECITVLLSPTYTEILEPFIRERESTT